MKNKAPLQMIEFVIMLLVFSALSALCLRAFSYANGISTKTALRDEAIIEAQNIAELLSYHKGDFSAASIDAVVLSDGHWQIEHENFTLDIIVTEHGSPLLAFYTITATDDCGEILAVIPVSWQKEVAK